jgi:pimeloyl-[acyl-carrier protein] methyl ester esterase
MVLECSSSYSTASPLVSRTQGTGTPLVLLHGWGLNSGVWQSVSEHLSKRFQVISVDLPGFGDNVEHLPEEYSLKSLCDWVTAKIPEDAILIGWSMGGLVAQQIAANDGHLLKGLITLASTPCFQQKSDWDGIKPHVLSAFEKQLEDDYAKTLSRFLAIQALGSPDSKSEIKQLKKAISAFPAPAIKALQGGLKLLADVDLRGSIMHITVPTLRLYGRLDSLVPANGIVKIQKLQPNSEHYIFQHAAHAPFISHPQEWLKVIQEYADSL